jgi:hypothetical protein
MAQRVDIQTGSFFEYVPAADVLLMKSVLHDWDDEKCQVILGHCRQAMHRRILRSPHASIAGRQRKDRERILFAVEGSRHEAEPDHFHQVAHENHRSIIIATLSPSRAVSSSMVGRANEPLNLTPGRFKERVVVPSPALKCGHDRFMVG